MQCILILKKHIGTTVPPGPQMSTEFLRKQSRQSVLLIKYTLTSNTAGLDKGLKLNRKEQKCLLTSLPATLTPCPPSCLQILGQKSQLNILHTCLSFFWPGLVFHLKGLTQGESSLGMVVLESDFVAGNSRSYRSLLHPYSYLFKFMKENSQGQHSLRPFWSPSLRSISSYNMVK